MKRKEKGQLSCLEMASLKKFTIIGATTRAGMLASPLRDRFGIITEKC